MTALRGAAVALIAISGLFAGCTGGGDANPPATTAATQAPPTSAVTLVPSPGPPTAAATAVAGTPVAGRYRVARAFPSVDIEQMTAMEVVPGEPDVALALARAGIVYRVDLREGAGDPTVFLDIRDRIKGGLGQEEGLLGLAFAPDYTTSHEFYIYYTRDNPRHNRISRYIAQGDHGDPASEHAIIDLPEKTRSNHNGGEITFGPDGYLYVGVGDGGGGGDPDENGQSTNSKLGKILRIDVSGDSYTIPEDNPFASSGGAPEIYAYGFRNPWRFSFDPATDNLWAADVGQGEWEEIDRVVRGANYGWNTMEGTQCYDPSSACDTSGLTLPRAEYSHDDGNCSVTGGYVYRGAAMPELHGWFVYGDYCSGKLWAVNTADGGPPVELEDTDKNISSFFRDAAGELYVVSLDGEVWRIERQ